MQSFSIVSKVQKVMVPQNVCLYCKLLQYYITLIVDTVYQLIIPLYVETWKGKRYLYFEIKSLEIEVNFS